MSKQRSKILIIRILLLIVFIFAQFALVNGMIGTKAQFTTENDQEFLENVSQSLNEPNTTSSVVITLSDTTTSYQRVTISRIDNISSLPGNIFSYRITADLTSHSDLYIQFVIEWKASSQPWNNNFTTFVNDPQIQDYNASKRALQSLIVEQELLSVLGITSRSFIAKNETRFGAGTQFTVFLIEDKYIVHETTAFLLNLQEFFQFDRNNVQIGKLSDFHFESKFDKRPNSDVVDIFELMRITSEGVPLTFDSKTGGYSGIIYILKHPMNQLRYNREFLAAKTNLELIIKFPDKQLITDSEYSTIYESLVGETTLNVSITENILTAGYSSDDWIPDYFYLASIPPTIPIWEQFTISDYVSWSISGLIGIVTVLKGVPFFIARRGVGSLKAELRKAAKNNNIPAINEFIAAVFKRYTEGKISQKQYWEMVEEAKMVKEQMQLGMTAQPDAAAKTLMTQT